MGLTSRRDCCIAHAVLRVLHACSAHAACACHSPYDVAAVRPQCCRVQPDPSHETAEPRRPPAAAGGATGDTVSRMALARGGMALVRGRGGTGPRRGGTMVCLFVAAGRGRGGGEAPAKHEPAAPKPKPAQWTVDELCEFFTAQELGVYVPAIRKGKADGRMLIDLIAGRWAGRTRSQVYAP